MQNKKYNGIEKLKSKYGFMFITPWLIGIILFFATPLIQSVLYSFSDVVLGNEGMELTFRGLKYYKYILLESPDYTELMRTSVLDFSYKLPLIVILSLILALMLNRQFKGRIFFRALFFLTVIISTGIALKLIFSTTRSDIASTAPESISDSIISVNDIMSFLDLPISIAEYVKTAISKIFDLVWNCGIQIILFISGLQTIPASLYEACRVEGATKWEQFWFITFPMLGRIVLLVVIFTMVELFTDTRNALMYKISTLMQSGTYDESSAMMWFYFIIVGGVIGIVILLFNKVLLKKWE